MSDTTVGSRRSRMPVILAAAAALLGLGYFIGNARKEPPAPSAAQTSPVAPTGEEARRAKTRTDNLLKNYTDTGTPAPVRKGL